MQPISEYWDWQMNAACRSMPVSMFYPPLGLRGYSLRNLERQAKLVCDRCPVIARCLQHALDSDEKYGVWGGIDRTRAVRDGSRQPWRAAFATMTSRRYCAKPDAIPL